MKRILLAWELGGNVGHIMQLRPLARKLRQSGYDVTFALRDISHANELIRRDGFRVLAAPGATLPRGLSREALFANSYLDILALEGLTDSDRLLSKVGVWQDIFAIADTDMLIAESAPFAVLAASMRGLPQIAIGTGFTLPPVDAAFPFFQPKREAGRERYALVEGRCLAAMNRLARTHGIPPFGRAHELFRDARRMLVTWPELDHYGRSPGDLFIGPLPTLSVPLSNPESLWTQSGETQRVLGYLQPDYPNLEAVIAALAERNVDAVLVVPGGEQMSGGRHHHPRVRILNRRVSLTSLLPGADIVISHAGHNLAVEALTHGKSMLALPQHMEQAMLSRRMAAANLCTPLSPAEAGSIPLALGRLLAGDQRSDVRAFADTRASQAAEVALNHIDEAVVQMFLEA